MKADMPKNLFDILLFVILITSYAVVIFALYLCQVSAATQEEIPFDHVIIDSNGPDNMHSKSVGDINGRGWGQVSTLDNVKRL